MSDGEIEYLDEDEEIIQQILQKPVKTLAKVGPLSSSSLLAKRQIGNKRKPKAESDSDYDPTDDLEADAMRKLVSPAKKRPRNDPQKLRTYEGPKNNTKVIPKLQTNKQLPAKPTEKKRHYELRKTLEIRIPDFEDPLCLPVRAIKKDQVDLKKLRDWNNICLEKYRNYELSYPEPKIGKIIGSSRVITFKNVKNKKTGTLEAQVCFSSVTRNELGERKTQQSQAILPRYREKRDFSNYKLYYSTRKTGSYPQRHEALLTMENINNEPVLVVYKPRDSISAVYKLTMEEREEAPPRRVLKEATVTMACAPCYQVSWRGVGSNDDKEPIYCKICNRTFVSVYNMLSHLKTHHKPEEVRRHKLELSRSLAKVVQYHYRCRICLRTCPTIQQLRPHVASHKGDETFKCEIGDHETS